MTRTLIALAIAVTLSLFMPLMLEWRSAAWFGWRVELPPLPKAASLVELHAAPPTPISDNCEPVATVGIIEYYFCETNYGDFFTNSFGFMLPPDY